MANKLITQFKSLPKYGQVAIGIGGIVVVYLLYKRVFQSPTFKSSKPKRLKTNQDIENVGNTIIYNPTPYVLDYNQLATDLFNAMDGLGTNVTNVKSTIEEMRNQKDWDALKNAFGTRTISSGYYFNSYKGNLKQCLTSELSSSDLNSIKDTLASKGISF